MMGGMHEFIEILNARAKTSPSDGSPTFEVDHNGIRLSIDGKTRETFDSAAPAFEQALVLASELLGVPGWTPVSQAEVSAVLDPPVSPRAPLSGWRGRVQLLFATDEQVRADRQVPYRLVTGVLKDQ